MGAGKIFAYTPRPPFPYIGRVIPRYRLLRLHIRKFRQPKRLSHSTELPLFFFLPHFTFLFFSPSPLFAFISARAPISRSISLSPFLSSLLLPRRSSFSRSLFFSLAQCASENMNPSPRIVYDSVSRTFHHCVRMMRGQREKLRAVLNECEKKRRDGDGDGRNLH